MGFLACLVLRYQNISSGLVLRCLADLYETAVAHPNQRGYWLIAHRGRGLLMIMGFVMLLTAVVAYGIANWWFGKIEFQPQGVAVFGSVGIVLLSSLLDCLRNYALFEKKLTRINSRIKEMTMMSDEPQVKNPQLIHLMHLLRADQNDEPRAAFYAGLKTAKFMLPVGTARTGDPTVVLLTDDSGRDFLPIFTDQPVLPRALIMTILRLQPLTIVQIFSMKTTIFTAL